MSDESHRELLNELDSEWHELKHGNPVPGLFPQTGTEIVKVRGNSRIEDNQTITSYEIIVTDGGIIVGRYRVLAEEKLADYHHGYDGDEPE